MLAFPTDKCALMALRCMAIMFTPTKTKKMGDNIPYIMQVVPVSKYDIGTTPLKFWP